MKGSSLQWSFSKPSSTTSQILSFKSVQEQEGSHKLCPPGFPQINLPLDNKQGERRYPVTGHPWQRNDVLFAPEAKLFPVTGQAKQMGPAAISSSLLPPHLNAPTLSSSFVGGTSAVSSTSVLPPSSSVVGATDLKNSPSVSSSPCQLTIFYNGSVCVYDNVAPDKAQAIMLLAGNGDSTNSTSTSTSVPFLPKAQPTLLRLPVYDTPITGQSKGSVGAISLPTSVSLLSAIQSKCTTELNLLNPVITSTQIKVPGASNSVAPVGAGGVKSIKSAVPQARKASLARFLEKRKERVTAASPYPISKSIPESFVANSSGDSPLLSSN